MTDRDRDELLQAMMTWAKFRPIFTKDEQVDMWGDVAFGKGVGEVWLNVYDAGYAEGRKVRFKPTLKRVLWGLVIFLWTWNFGFGIVQLVKHFLPS